MSPAMRSSHARLDLALLHSILGQQKTTGLAGEGANRLRWPSAVALSIPFTAADRLVNPGAQRCRSSPFDYAAS